MTRATVLVFLALTACKTDPVDTGETGEPAAGPAVGDVWDLATDESGVQVDFTEPGTYVVILMSQAEELDTSYGYSDEVSAPPRIELPTPLPAPGHGPKPEGHRSEREFTVWNGSRAVTITAELVELTDELIIWKDITTENPLGEIEESTLDDIVEKFEGIVLPRTRQIFGEISDVEGSERIDVLVSYTVNQYGAVAYVSSCDIGALDGCGGWGNGSEIIYMGIPDPESSYSSANAITEIWSHELNHLVYGWHKYILNDQLSASENIYLTEGFSELAQDLTGFNNGNQYIWAAAIDMRDHYGDEDYSTQGISINDVLRGHGYYDADRDGPLRGAAYLFLRYLFEQQGGMTVNGDGSLVDDGGMAWLHAWFDAPELGPECVEATTGRDLLDLAMDWYTAIVVTGRDLNDEPAYNYQDRVQDPLTTFEFGVDPFATIHGWLVLNGPPIQPLDEADGWLRAGGVEYLQVTVSEPGTVSIPVDPAALPRARALRIE
ncbi:MAG: hypothetical protein ABIO70_22310 [Pseudomonadota bacterium]